LIVLVRPRAGEPPDSTSLWEREREQINGRMPSPGGPTAAGQGEVLGHATWPPQASAGGSGVRSASVPDGGSASLHNSPDRISRRGPAPKRSGFNMKARDAGCSTVDTHSERTEVPRF